MVSSQQKRPWSEAEDQLLLQLVPEQDGINWVRVAKTLGTRTAKQCRERFHQNLEPTLDHTPITTDEGAYIEEQIAAKGKRWAAIARRLPGRSDNAVQNWWNGHRRKRLHQRRTADPGACDDSHYRQPNQHHHLPTPTLPSPSSPAHGYWGYYPDSIAPSPTLALGAFPRSEYVEMGPTGLSDMASSIYTTAPHGPVQLPPLRNISCETHTHPRSMALPGVQALLYPPRGDDRLFQGCHLPPLQPCSTLTSQLPTAPSPPLGHPPTSQSWQFSACGDKDSQMAISQMIR